MPTKEYIITEYILNYILGYVPHNIRKELPKLNPLDSQTLTVVEKLDILGVKSYDTAIPHNWVLCFVDMLGVSPVGHFVWSYDNNSGGIPYPITRQGVILLEVYIYLEDISEY